MLTSIFTDITDFLGDPDLDLFALRLNHQVKRYFSWTLDPFCEQVDAFTVDWDRHLFPPFSMISKTISKLAAEGATSILVFPLWPTQSWLPYLLDLIISPVILLPELPLYLPWDHDCHHSLEGLLIICSVKLSGQYFLISDFRKELQNCSWTDSLTQSLATTLHHSTNGILLLHKGKLIPFIPLSQC